MTRGAPKGCHMSLPCDFLCRNYLLISENDLTLDNS